MLGDPNGAVYALFRSYAAEEAEIRGFDRLRPKQVFRQTMMDGSDPARLRQRTALRVRDRNDRHGREFVEHRLGFGQIQAAVQGGGKWRRLPGKQGERIIVEMKMQKIELARALIDALEHQHVQPVGIADRTVEPQCTRPYGL